MLVSLFTHVAYAQPISDAELTRRLMQQQEEARGRLGNAPDVFSQPTAIKKATVLEFPGEAPCFVISTVELRDAQLFEWLYPAANLALHHCIGAKGLRLLQDHLAGELINRGYVTARVLIPEQNLSVGHLVIQLVPGRISLVRSEGTPVGLHRMALPQAGGGLLNQRDLDQALENIRRLSGQQGVEFDLVPSAAPGETDLVIRHPDAKRWRALISLDDSGAAATGKYQLGGVLTIDSPLYLYDALTLTLNNNANYGNGTLGTNSSSISWSVPFGYWMLSLAVNRSVYKQTVAGFMGDIVYGGRSHGAEIGLTYVPYRTGNAKAFIQFKLNRKISRSHIDDVEIDVQHRDVSGYEVNFNHRQYIGQNTLDVGFGLRGSLPEQSRSPGMIVGVPDWDGRYRIGTANVNLIIPFQLAKQNLRYQASWRLQHTSSVLPAAEFFSIGSRYSVRGFDGASTLSAESGWMLRNDVVWSLSQSAQEVFLAFDTGRVSGSSADLLLGRALTGAALGLRGKLGSFNYDASIGWPLKKPEAFKTQKPTFTAYAAAEF